MWFSYDECEGFKTHKTEAKAREYAQYALESERDSCAWNEEWSDVVDEICWGKVIEKVVETKRDPAPPEASFEEYVDYGLREVAKR